MRNQASPSANARRPWRPVVRSTRWPRSPILSAASERVATRCQRSPGCGDQPGRSRRRSGIAVVAQACAAEAEIRSANGWVASTTASTAFSSSQRASASGPPKPPVRTAPSGSRGLATRPASEVVTAMPSATSAAASVRASAVPPSTRITDAHRPAPGLDHGRVRDRRDRRRLRGPAHGHVPGPGDDRPARREAARLRARGRAPRAGGRHGRRGQGRRRRPRRHPRRARPRDRAPRRARLRGRVPRRSRAWARSRCPACRCRSGSRPSTRCRGG